MSRGAVPLVRRLWGLIHCDDGGASRISFVAHEPSEDEVSAAAGVLLLTGMLEGDCPAMTLPIVGELPRQPRFDLFTGVTDAKGEAPIVFDPPFAATPKAEARATPRVLAGPYAAEIIAGSLTRSGCRVKVTTSALTTGVVTGLAGAAVTVIAIGG